MGEVYASRIKSQQNIRTADTADGKRDVVRIAEIGSVGQPCGSAIIDSGVCNPERQDREARSVRGRIDARIRSNNRNNVAVLDIKMPRGKSRESTDDRGLANRYRINPS